MAENDESTEEQKAAAEAEAKAKANVEAAKQQDRQDMLADIDARIAARDKAILEAMQQLVDSVKSGKPSDAKVDDNVTEQLGITPQDFWSDPVASLEKFYKIKIAPAIAEGKTKAGDKADDSGVQALIETKKIKLKELNPEEFAKYSPFFDKVAQRTDPSVLATDQGFDAVWRLTKSYTDDHLASEERQRQEKLQHANLVPGTGVTPKKEDEVKYTDSEKSAMSGMGISPELYTKYSSADEVDIDAGRRAKK